MSEKLLWSEILIIEEFKLKLTKLNELKTQYTKIGQEIHNLTEEIYKQYKCKYLRICNHCGQDGSDTVRECDYLKREICANDCDILRCLFCDIIKR